MEAIFFSGGDIATSLYILVLGWGGIFVVMFVIYLVSLGLAKFFPPQAGE